jgi:hypothetical protein
MIEIKIPKEEYDIVYSFLKDLQDRDLVSSLNSDTYIQDYVKEISLKRKILESL